MNAWFSLFRHGALTRFARGSEWFGALAAGGLISAITASVWHAASPDPRVATQAVLGWLVAASVAGRTDEWLATRWTDGGLAADLARPVSLGVQLLLRDLGRAATGLATVSLPLALVLGARPDGVLFLPALLLAAVCGHAFGLLSGIATIGLGAPAGTTWVRSSLLALLSGAAVPPAAGGPFEGFFVYGPFGALAGAPAALFTGAGLGVLGVQFAWVLLWLATAHAALSGLRDRLGATGP